MITLVLYNGAVVEIPCESFTKAQVGYLRELISAELRKKPSERNVQAHNGTHIDPKEVMAVWSS